MNINIPEGNDDWSLDSMFFFSCFSFLCTPTVCVQWIHLIKAPSSHLPPKWIKRKENLPLLEPFLKVVPHQCLSPHWWSWVTATDMWPLGRNTNGDCYSLEGVFQVFFKFSVCVCGKLHYMIIWMLMCKYVHGSDIVVRFSYFAKD